MRDGGTQETRSFGLRDIASILIHPCRSVECNRIDDGCGSVQRLKFRVTER